MTDVLIRRDLLEDLRDAANDCLNHEIMRGNDRNVPAYTELVEQADAALAAPRQPEGEGLEVVEEVNVVGWLGGNGLHTEESMASGAPFPLMTVAQHQRILEGVRQQRDKLSGLLYDASGELRTDRHHGLGPRIDAALAEVNK